MDGLMDNVFPSEMLSALHSRVAGASGTDNEQVQVMVKYAQQCMNNWSRVGPCWVRLRGMEGGYPEV